MRIWQERVLKQITWSQKCISVCNVCVLQMISSSDLAGLSAGHSYRHFSRAMNEWMKLAGVGAVCGNPSNMITAEFTCCFTCTLSWGFNFLSCSIYNYLVANGCHYIMSYVVSEIVCRTSCVDIFPPGREKICFLKHLIKINVIISVVILYIMCNTNGEYSLAFLW